MLRGTLAAYEGSPKPHRSPSDSEVHGFFDAVLLGAGVKSTFLGSLQGTWLVLRVYWFMGTLNFKPYLEVHG